MDYLMTGEKWALSKGSPRSGHVWGNLQNELFCDCIPYPKSWSYYTHLPAFLLGYPGNLTCGYLLKWMPKIPQQPGLPEGKLGFKVGFAILTTFVNFLSSMNSLVDSFFLNSNWFTKLLVDPEVWILTEDTQTFVTFLQFLSIMDYLMVRLCHTHDMSTISPQDKSRINLIYQFWMKTFPHTSH